MRTLRLQQYLASALLAAGISGEVSADACMVIIDDARDTPAAEAIIARINQPTRIAHQALEPDDE